MGEMCWQSDGAGTKLSFAHRVHLRVRQIGLWGRQFCLRARFQRAPAGWKAGLQQLAAPQTKLAHYTKID